MASGWEKDFSAQIQAFARKVNDRADSVVRIAALELTSRIINRTPVDTGKAKANWQVAIDHPPLDSKMKTDTDGGATLGVAASILAKARFLSTIYVTNNVEYVVGLEYGKSKQAPAGMVRISVAEWDEIVAHALAMSQNKGG